MTSKPPAEPAQQLLANAPLMAMVLLLVDSLHFVFARLLRPYLSPEVSALYVMGVATVELVVFLSWRRQIRLQEFWAHWRFFLTIGLMVALSTSLTYASVSYVDAGTAALLAQMSIVFALGLSLFWLREKLNRIEGLGAVIALSGVFIVSFQPGDVLRLGSLLVLTAAFSYALHTAVVKRYGGEIEFANFFLFRVATTTFFLLMFGLGRGHLAWPPAQVWPLLIVVGTVDVIISRVLYYLVLRRLQMSYHALLLTLSPVITILWSMALFGERPTSQGLVGGMAVIAGIIVVTRGRQRQKPAQQT